MQSNQGLDELKLSGSISRKLHRKGHGLSTTGRNMQGGELKSKLRWILSTGTRARSCSWQNLFLLMVVLPLLYFMCLWSTTSLELPSFESDLRDQHNLTKLPESGLTYRSQEFFERIWPALEAGNFTSHGKVDLITRQG